MVSSTSTPQAVLDAISSLSDAEKKTVQEYIDTLHEKIAKFEGEESPEYEKMDDDEKEANDEEGDLPPLYEEVGNGAEDFEKAGDLKQQAADAKSAKDWEKALDLYNQAVVAAPPSAMLYGNRGLVLLEMGRPKAAERDGDAALALNPDSVKALRVRGRARQALENWEGALSDLSQAQQIDFDPDVAAEVKLLSTKHTEHEKELAKDRIAKEEKLRKRAQEIKEAQEEEKRKQAEEASRSMPGGMPGGMGGMPGGMGGMPGGMPGGMGGMPGMGAMGGIMEMLKSDPELQEAMKNPKVIAAFGELMNGPGGPMGIMSNPGKLQEMMADPEVGPIMQKIMAKFAGGIPGMGGMGGGMGGAGAPPSGGDDIPDLDDLPDLE